MKCVFHMDRRLRQFSTLILLAIFCFSKFCYGDVAIQKKAVIAKLKELPAYVNAVNDRDSKLKAKELILDSGSPEDIAKASGNYMEAKEKVSTIEEKAFLAAGITPAQPVPHPALKEAPVEAKHHWALKSTCRR